MKVLSGIIIGAIVGAALVIFAYFYIGEFSTNSVIDLGKSPGLVAAESQKAQNTVKTNSTNQSNGSNTNNSNNGNESTEINQSSSNPANFDALLKGPYINGVIGGNSPVLISLNHPVISNGVMTLNEYYPIVPSEEFTLKVVSSKPNNFIMYEYYNGKHTGTYNLVLNGYSLSGSFTHITNGLTSQVSLNIYGAASNYIGSTPFLKGKIGNSGVVICTGNIDINNMTEFYESNDKNTFEVHENFKAQKQGTNNVVLDEYYGGKQTGIYNGIYELNGTIQGTYTNLTTHVVSNFILNPSYTN